MGVRHGEIQRREVEMDGAEEIVRQVMTGDWRCPTNDVPTHRAVTSNPATAERAAKDVVEALRTAGLLKPYWYRGETDEKQTLLCDYDPYMCPDEVTVRLDDVKLVVGRVSRMRDGGTTIIETEVGRITIPTPFRGDLKPTVTTVRP
jgi:hypothetical protein